MSGRETTVLRAIISLFLLFLCGISPVCAETPVSLVVPVRPRMSVPLEDEKGHLLRPSACLKVGADLYFLDVDCLWICKKGLARLKTGEILSCKRTSLPGLKVGGVPLQEFLSFTYFPARKSIIVLDKSGSLFEFFCGNGLWAVFRANQRILGSPDPHYLALAAAGDHICLLDPERNQIWRYPARTVAQRYFKDVLPWRIRSGDPNVSDAIDFVIDGATYVLRRDGRITRYPSDAHGGNGNPQSVNWRHLSGLRPSRLGAGGDLLYVIERENNRVFAIDRRNGQWKQFLFGPTSDLRGMLVDADGFWIIDGNRFVFRSLAQAEGNKESVFPRRLDPRFSGIAIPIQGAHLPHHPGVYPGARRLYRHGVHQGLDFFHDPGAGTRVAMDTPAIAAETGKVIRADVHYKDMTAAEYSRIMHNCNRDQFCSEADEDQFRGCQVWLDHGNGLITRYAHLNKARSDLKPGMIVKRGEVVGYIGVSGTGENHPGRLKHPHLHFELWLDGHYLGYGLSTAETVGAYEDIFNRRSVQPKH